ncbi:hypothetical protein ANCDUO_25208 [Ancylostoma duodenale]|uniref:Uncharacterized protein n=1 Tax=Ancylostoma duodenale TaxID=51022 RepID=A0A0C2FDG1_9BILA|nr:hypothetical protein ANCDUO_25208 [Ancylostoma duodenale]
MRAFVHSNGWVRLWAIEKLVSVDPSIMAANQDNDDFARLLWVRARLSGEGTQLQKRLELELADRLTAIEDGVDVGLSPDIVEAVDILLCILFVSPRGRVSFLL